LEEVGARPNSLRIRREFKDEVQHWRILASVTGYVDSMTGCAKPRLASVLLQEQGRLLLVGL